MDTFGTALRSYRSSRKLKQADLAGQLGLTRAYISQVETGTSVFSRETMLAAAVAMRLSPDEVATLDALRNAYAGVPALPDDGIKRLAALEAAVQALSQTVADLAGEVALLRGLGRGQGDYGAGAQ